MTEKTGPEFIAEFSKNPTLDEFMRRNPRSLSDDEIRDFIKARRAERAQFIATGGKKKESDDGE